MFEGPVAQRLLALFALGWLLWSFPLLGLWDRGISVLGVPLLPAALFVGWGVLIALLAWVNECGAKLGDGPLVEPDSRWRSDTSFGSTLD
jgi:hypothetical protein